MPDKTLPPATRKVHPIAIIVDDFDKCVIRRKIAEDGFKNITAERLRSVCEYAGQGTTSVKARLRGWSSTLQKIRQVKKTDMYCYDI